MTIDSTYRDSKQYFYSTEFGVIVNPTPGNQNASNIYTVQNIIYSRFQWSGTATTTILNDTVVGNFVDYSASVITLDPSSASPDLNFYMGCEFIMDSSGVSSVIAAYDPNLNTVTLVNPIAPTYYDSSNTGYRIVNPSYTYGNNLLLLGSNLYVNLSNDNINNLFLLKSGPTNSLFIQNVTQGWVLPIDKILENFRMVAFATDMPSYHNGDLFQIRQSDRILAYTTLAASTTLAIQDYSIAHPGIGYTVGTIVSVENGITIATYEITATDAATGGIRELRLLDPGSGYSVGSVAALLAPGGNNSAQILIEKVASVLPISGTPPPSDTYILYVPYMSPLITAFFTILEIQGNLVFFLNTSITPIAADQPVELMIYRQTPTGLTMPVVSYKQPVCYDVSLVHLILPNQPVYGFNVLPTFFPYLMIELYNTSNPGSNAGILYSNNPNTEKVSFYCPIGNPKNPLVVSYLIILSSTQVQTMKWTPTDNFFFRVLMPNGRTLTYNFDLDVNENDILTGQLQTLATSDFHFWGQLTDRRVTATFSFRLKS